MILYSLDVDRFWLILGRPGQPPIRVDVRSVDRILAEETRLVLSIGTAKCSIAVAQEEVRGALQQLAPYTRSAPIERHEVYVDAKRRAELIERNRRDNGALSVYFGDDDVYVTDKKVTIGRRRHWIQDIKPYADLDLEIELPGGRLPATLIMLVVAAFERVEDSELLLRRIREYEEAQ